MPTDKLTQSLTDYLANATTPQDAVVVVAEEPIEETAAIAPTVAITANLEELQPDNEMLNLMAKLKRIGMCAKDLHYRAKGKPFYGLHLLADLAHQIEEDTDSIAEIYFMGDRGIEPPRMTDVFAKAIDELVLYPRNDKYFIGGLMSICRITMLYIEEIKKKFEVKSGVAAVLDKISEHSLLIIGLLDQTMKE